MNAEDRRQPPGFPMRPPGVGMAHNWQCFGCKQVRFSTLGARGVGLRKRCAQCVGGKA